MRLTLAELVISVCEEINKARKYLYVQANSTPYLNIQETECEIPVVFCHETKSLNTEALKNTDEKFLELQIPFNYENSILKKEISDKLEQENLKGIRVLCEVSKESTKLPIGKIKMRFSLFPKV